jgi:homoserine trans-succinylase
VQHVFETPFPAIKLGFFSPGNMGAIRRYQQWNKDRVANGIQICWLITAGYFCGRHQQKNTKDKRREN